MGSAVQQATVALSPDDFYSHALSVLQNAGVPFMLGGAYAFVCYTGIERDTKDLDLFVHPHDREAALEAMRAAGYRAELLYSHWLAKAFLGEHFVDIIFSSGNGIATVDEEWFEHATDGEFLGIAVKVCPPEEMLWSKLFVAERERYDGADVAHLLRAQADNLDWPRLLRRLDTNWPVLLSHLMLFGFVYPGERSRIPRVVLMELFQRWQNELAAPAHDAHLCRGTLLSRAQYLVDVDEWGYQDARQLPYGTMTAEQIAIWTAAIDE